MKKTRNAHVWIGLIASLFIFLESITGLLMNEPWLIGQSSQVEGNRVDFQPGQFNRGTVPEGSTPDASQGAGQTNGQTQGQNGTTMQIPGGQGRPGGENLSQGTVMSTIRGLHEGMIGTTSVKWLIDLIALALIFLTGSGIYLSLKVLLADKKKGKGKSDGLVM